MHKKVIPFFCPIFSRKTAKSPISSYLSVHNTLFVSKRYLLIPIAWCDSKSVGSDTMWVRVSLPAPKKTALSGLFLRSGKDETPTNDHKAQPMAYSTDKIHCFDFEQIVQNADPPGEPDLLLTYFRHFDFSFLTNKKHSADPVGWISRVLRFMLFSFPDGSDFFVGGGCGGIFRWKQSKNSYTSTLVVLGILTKKHPAF